MGTCARPAPVRWIAAAPLPLLAAPGRGCGAGRLATEPLGPRIDYCVTFVNVLSIMAGDHLHHPRSTLHAFTSTQVIGQSHGAGALLLLVGVWLELRSPSPL
jgi:hypothetical protein